MLSRLWYIKKVTCDHTASVFGRYFTLTYTADNGRTRCRRSQWHRAALTCTDLTVETKLFCFFPAMYASVSCSFVLAHQCLVFVSLY